MAGFPVIYAGDAGNLILNTSSYYKGIEKREVDRNLRKKNMEKHICHCNIPRKQKDCKYCEGTICEKCFLYHRRKCNRGKKVVN